VPAPTIANPPTPVAGLALPLLFPRSCVPFDPPKSGREVYCEAEYIVHCETYQAVRPYWHLPFGCC
jgi:hypothetical protein